MEPVPSRSPPLSQSVPRRLPRPLPRGCSEIPADNPRGRALTGRARGGTEGGGRSFHRPPPTCRPPGEGGGAERGSPKRRAQPAPPRSRFPPRPGPLHAAPRGLYLWQIKTRRGQTEKAAAPPARLREGSPPGRAGVGEGGAGRARGRRVEGGTLHGARGAGLGRRADSRRPAAGARHGGQRDQPRGSGTSAGPVT